MQIVIILVVLIALAGGGVFGVSMFAPDLLPPPVAALMGVAPPEGDEEENKEEEVLSTVLVDIEPVSIPLFRDGIVDRFLIMHALIECRSADQALVTQNLPRIVDSIITYVHALAALDIEPGIKDRAFLKSHLIVKLNELFGRDVVVNLLFQNLFERTTR